MSWIISLFTSGAFIIVAIYLSIPVFHLLKGVEGRRQLKKRIAAGKLNPNGFECRLEVGDLHLRSGRWKKAIEELEQAVEIHDEHAHARSLLGTALFHEGEFERAREELEKALELRPSEGYGQTQTLIARCYEGLNDPDNAVAWYRAARERNSSICEPGYRMALVLKGQGKVAEYQTELAESVNRFSRYDRGNYWKNLPYLLSAKFRLLFGV